MGVEKRNTANCERNATVWVWKREIPPTVKGMLQYGCGNMLWAVDGDGKLVLLELF